MLFAQGAPANLCGVNLYQVSSFGYVVAVQQMMAQLAKAVVLPSVNLTSVHVGCKLLQMAKIWVVCQAVRQAMAQSGMVLV